MSHKFFREIPDEGSIDNMFDRLYNYINKVDEVWIKRVKPASKDKIDRLIMLSDIKKIHVSFPREYIKFLEIMGDDDGGVLSSCIKSETKIDNLSEFYEWIDEDRKNGIEDEDFKESKIIFAYDDMHEECYIKLFENGEHRIISGYEESKI